MSEHEELARRYAAVMPNNLSILSMQKAWEQVPDELIPELIELMDRIDVEAIIRFMEIVPPEVMTLMFAPEPDLDPRDFEENSDG